MKFLLISPKNRTVYNFRGDLIKQIKNKGYEVVVIGPNKDNIEKIYELGANFRELELDKNSTGLISNINYYKGLKNIISEEKPDIILSYTIKPVIFGTLAAKKVKIKNTYSLITGLGQVYGDSNSIKIKLLRLICGIAYKNVFKYNNKVIFQNNDDKEECIKRKYLKAEKAEVVDGSGVNLEKFVKKELPEENVFLMISRMMKAKGTLEYFEAAKIVKEKYPDAKFLYLGKIENQKGYVSYKEIQSYLEQNIVEIIDETDDVPNVIAKTKIIVLPSYYREGIPRTLLEALAMGRPIITTNSVGCKETVKDGQNGFLIPTKNIGILAEKMIYMIEHREEIQGMSNISYEYCKKRFDVNIINKKMLDIMKI